MVWTSPKVFATGEILTASDMNTFVSANTEALRVETYDHTLIQRDSTTDDPAFVQWGDQLVVTANEPKHIRARIFGAVECGTAVTLTRCQARVEISDDGGATWTQGKEVSASVKGADADTRWQTIGAWLSGDFTPATEIRVRAMTLRTISTSGAVAFRESLLAVEVTAA